MGAIQSSCLSGARLPGACLPFLERVFFSWGAPSFNTTTGITTTYQQPQAHCAFHIRSESPEELLRSLPRLFSTVTPNSIIPCLIKYVLFHLVSRLAFTELTELTELHDRSPDYIAFQVHSNNRPGQSQRRTPLRLDVSNISSQARTTCPAPGAVFNPSTRRHPSQFRELHPFLRLPGAPGRHEPWISSR